MPKAETSAKDVEKSREKVDKLRDQLASVKSDLAASEAGRNNTVRKATLDNEAERLQAELAAARERLRVSKGEDPASIVDAPLDDETPTESTVTDDSKGK